VNRGHSPCSAAEPEKIRKKIPINNHNTEVITNKLLKIPRSYIALETFHGQRNYFFEFYRQFGHAHSKMYAIPGVGYGVQDITSLKSQTEKLSLTVHTPCIIPTRNNMLLLQKILERNTAFYDDVDVQIG
jgi:hypothetical protein